MVGMVASSHLVNCLRTYELLLLRGKSLGRRSLALRGEDSTSAGASAVTAALEELGRAILERPRAAEPLVEVGHGTASGTASGKGG